MDGQILCSKGDHFQRVVQRAKVQVFLKSMRYRKRQKGGKIEPKHLLQYPAQPSPFLGLIKTDSCAFTQEIQV